MLNLPHNCEARAAAKKQACAVRSFVCEARNEARNERSYSN